MVEGPAISTLLFADTNCIWYFNDDWSFENIASVPAVYCTVVYGLQIVRSNLKFSSLL